MVAVEGCLCFSQAGSGSSLRSGNGSSVTFRLGLGGSWAVWNNVARFAATKAEVVVHSSLALFGLQFAVRAKRSEILLVLLPGLALLALAAGAAFFWSFFLDWLFVFNFYPLAF